MKTVKGYVKTKIVGSDCKFEFEVEDDATEDEIEEAAYEAAMEIVEFWYDVETEK